MIKRLTVEKMRLLADTGAIKSIDLIGCSDGFTLQVNAKGDVGGLLETDKGHVRTFSKLDTAAKLIKDMGLGKASLDVTSWTPGQRSV